MVEFSVCKFTITLDKTDKNCSKPTSNNIKTNISPHWPLKIEVLLCASPPVCSQGSTYQLPYCMGCLTTLLETGRILTECTGISEIVTYVNIKSKCFIELENCRHTSFLWPCYKTFPTSANTLCCHNPKSMLSNIFIPLSLSHVNSTN